MIEGEWWLEWACAELGLDPSTTLRFLASRIYSDETFRAEAVAFEWAEKKYGCHFWAGTFGGDLISRDAAKKILIEATTANLTTKALRRKAIHSAEHARKFGLEISLVVGVRVNPWTSKVIDFVEVEWQKEARTPTPPAPESG